MQGLKNKIQLKDNEISKLRQRLKNYEQLSDRINTHESGHSENIPQRNKDEDNIGGQTLDDDEKRQSSGVDQEIVEFF